MNILYFCYQSIVEPLTQTQVVAYLEGLVSVGYRVVLLTFEPRSLEGLVERNERERLRAKGIEWRWIRYHKRPRVPATAWDILVGIYTAWRIIQADRRSRWIVHARSHVPGVMGAIVKRLTEAKFLFDIRGFLAEEYADAGILKPGGLLYRTIKRVERWLVREADALVVLTRRAKELLESWYPQEIRGKPIEVIPCCVDLRNAQPRSRGAEEQGSNRNSEEERGRGAEGSRGEEEQRDKSEGVFNLVYVGKLGGWYLTEEIVRFVAVARQMVPSLQWQVWTQSDPAILEPLLERYGLTDYVSIGIVPPEQLVEKLRGVDAGLVFDGRQMSAAGVSPTKIGEYLAAGLPVVVNAGIGDVEDLLNGQGSIDGRVGVIVREFTEEAYRDAMKELLALLAEPDIRERCRKVAEEHLDLERVGWARYRRVYAYLTQET